MFSCIELHFSNRCTADCVVCSKSHGNDNPLYLQTAVFDALIAQLARAEYADTVQLGGDGDAFLHPDFLDCIAELRARLPKAHLCLYTNGFLLTAARADLICRGRMLDEVQVRIDSLDPNTYRKSTGLELDLVLENLEYFSALNDFAHLCIIYMPIHLYPTYCRQILGKEPTYFTKRGLDESKLRDEFEDVKAYFKTWSHPPEVRKTGICLWAERTDCEYSEFPCPQLDSAWQRQIYVLPNGDVMTCPYCDDQNTFILGNVLREKLADLWTSDKKKAFAEQVRNRTRGNHPAACVNALCCRMWDSLPEPHICS